MKIMKHMILFSMAILFQLSAVLQAHWRFEEVSGRNGNRTLSVLDESLSSGGRRGGNANGSPYVWDDTGKGNFLQVNGQSPIFFSDDVPKAQVNGKPNTRSLALKRGEPKEIQMKEKSRSVLFDKDYSGNFTIAPYEPEFIEIK